MNEHKLRLNAIVLNQDCASSPFSTRDVGLPEPKAGFKETMRFFDKEFGFTGLALICVLSWI